VGGCVKTPVGRRVCAANDGSFVDLATRGNSVAADRSASNFSFIRFEAAVIRVGSEAAAAMTRAGAL
jgi:hypothetical protein